MNGSETSLVDIPAHCLCGKDEGFCLFPYPGSQIHNNAPEQIQWCEACQLGQAKPMMDDTALSSLYEGGEYWRDSAGTVSAHLQPVPFALAEARWELIQKNLNRKSGKDVVNVLDVGAGQGCLGLVAAKHSDVHYLAVEPDKSWHSPLREAAKRENLGDRISVCSSLDEVESNADVIVLSQVLEHVNQPILYLKQLRNHLCPGGVILVDVPHVDFRFKADVFPHLYFFTPRSLKLVLELAGFEVGECNAWGRSGHANPLSDGYKSPWKFLARLIGAAVRRIELLGPLAVKFYGWYFGAFEKNPDGNWVRAIARNPELS